MSDSVDPAGLTLDALERCFGGAIPAVLATASADGLPNVTYLSRAHRVDHERIALSNQFMSKTARNLAGNPRASLLLMDPLTHDEFRVAVVYERTDRRGPVFDRLRRDVDALAALTGLQDVFRLRSADIFRVVDIVRIAPNRAAPAVVPPPTRDPAADLAAVAELTTRLGRAADLDVMVDTALDGLVQLLGYRHVHLLLLDEARQVLYTIVSRGFDAESIGAETPVGVGLPGMAAARCAPMRAGHLGQMMKYSASVRERFVAQGEVLADRTLAAPGLPDGQSRLAVPAMAFGQLVGVLVVDSDRPVAFGSVDEQLLTIVAGVLAVAIEHDRAIDQAAAEAEGTGPVTVDDRPTPHAESAGSAVESTSNRPPHVAPELGVRFFGVDGSVFFGNDYVIKGVAGRILWSMLQHHVASGRTEFTNRELRLDPRLELPGFKDNLESRLILLRRRLDEHDAPVRLHRTGRGRLQLRVDRPLRLEAAS